MSHRTPDGTVGITSHIVERGIDGSPCFLTDDDYLVYLDRLQEGAARHRCRIHAYALMIDQVHLLVSSDTEDRLARMIRCVRTRYVEYVNYVHQGNGAFRERRRESRAIESVRSLLDHYRLIESYPVTACMAASPAAYAWSSYNHHANGTADIVIRDHPAYLALGKTECERQSAYRESFRQPLDDRLPGEIGTSIASGRAPAPVRASDDVDWLAPQVQPRRSARPRTASHATAAF